MSKGTILVAEDDKYYSALYEKKLSDAGYSVIVVDNGQLVLEEAERQTPDLILLDLVMPVMDGFSTIRMLRSDQRFKTTPIIVLTVLGQEEDFKRAKDLGANDYFVKTDIGIDLLLKTIDLYLTKQE